MGAGLGEVARVDQRHAVVIAFLRGAEIHRCLLEAAVAHGDVQLGALRHIAFGPRGSLLEKNARDATGHDFGRDVIPQLIGDRPVYAYDFRRNRLTDEPADQPIYWRDVGTLDAYYEANMDLVDVTPQLNLYDRRWPIRTLMVQQPPAKFVFAQEGRRMGVAIDSIVSAGCIISGGRVLRSVLSPGVRVNSYCEVEYSILMPNVHIGRNSRIRRAIIDTNVEIPESSTIGFDAAQDRRSGHHVTSGGIVVVSGGEPQSMQSARSTV